MYSIRSMMNTLTLILIALAVRNSSAYLIKVPTSPLKPVTAPVGWVHIQKLMLPLFENVCEESTNEIVIRLAKEFILETSNGLYTKQDVVTNFQNVKNTKGLLPKGDIFSENNPTHMNEFKTLYEIFYYAEDFDTFYKAASWARQNINCGLFIDALYLAVLNRRDTAKVSIPAPYELLPNYFIRKDVIIKASSLLTGNEPTDVDNFRVENNAYVLDANYTVDVNDEDDSKLAYFREDIGLNSYYYLKKLRNPSWLNIPSNVNNYYGEYMYLMMKQFAARYDLERYSNGLPELESVQWDSVITAYNPMLIYSNGKEFGHRTFSGMLGDNEDVVFLKTIENNILGIVTHLRQAGHNKTQILNHIIEILATADKNYENVARRLLGYDVEGNERQYSSLEHYLTTLRDPVYWKINKKIVEMIDNSLKILPRYTRNELYFPGVEVLNVETKKMMTSFDMFQFDVTDSLKSTIKNTTYQVKIGQMRLNHKSFTNKLNISSLATQKGVVKIYIGPKIMPGELSLKKNLFILLDKFEFDFKRGTNIVSRSSEEMKSFSGDFISLQDLRKKVEDAEFGLDALPLKDVGTQVGYPSRLILPKGLPEGLPLQLFVFVAPFYKISSGSMSSVSRVFNSAILSPGYPFDLAIDEKMLFNLPNSIIKDIVITHKDESKSSNYGAKTGPKKWDSNKSYNSRSSTNDDSYENFDDNVENGEYLDYAEYKVHDLLSDRPAFTYKKEDNTDFTSKRNQYKNKESYTTKHNEYRQRNFEFNKASKEQPKLVNEIMEQDIASNKLFSNKNYDNGKIHGLLGSRTKYIHNRKENKDRKLNELNKNNDLILPIKVHGLLGDHPEFTYKNKNNFDYKEKKNQYKTKKEEIEAKRTQYKKGDYRKKDTDLVTKPEQVGVIKDREEITKDNTYKYIEIDDSGSGIHKNIYDDKLNKNMHVDKNHAEESEIITKDIKDPVIQNDDIFLKEINIKPYVILDDSSVEKDSKENEFVIKYYEPVLIPQAPRRRVTVYDYLFNFDDEENRVYE